jgi:hypothetical protein
LYDIHDDLPAWKSQIVEILQVSSYLETLGLSITNESVCRLYSDYQFDDYGNFFNDVCNEYEQAGSKPLPLRTLKCGRTACPLGANSIPKLVQLACLEEAHMENCGAWDNRDPIVMDSPADGESGVLFATFGPSNCPKLRRFTAGKSGRDVCDLLYAEQAPP